MSGARLGADLRLAVSRGWVVCPDSNVDGAAWSGDVLLYDPSMRVDTRVPLVISLLRKRNAFGPLHESTRKSDS